MATDTHRADIDMATAGAEAVGRNAGIISEREQAALRAATALVAGCGGGGGVVEPPARIGTARGRRFPPHATIAKTHPKIDGDLLLHLDHPQAAFGLVVVERNAEVDHVPLVPGGAVPQAHGQGCPLALERGPVPA
ncbi:hypothetical protein PV408_19450 [Streptomyces sp. ME18-1-4]|nr:hypothetical protein [Streptomyces sp. ME18-1-4]MDX3243935.1 hypothetical protein [Streptomyces sp. ME18-1-4]